MKPELLAKRCKNRGGDCPCKTTCQAVEAIDAELRGVRMAEIDLKMRRERLENTKLRLQTKPATLKDGFKFKDGLEPVMIFDGGECYFGYEDSAGDWTDSSDWPFNEDTIFYDDCERNGIRVE